jgi:predicted transcriptional regulator of viral defense system
MQTLTEQLIDIGLADEVITSEQLQRLYPERDKARYGLVNRALKHGELELVKRGTYILTKKFRFSPPHPFALAQSYCVGSYVSFETALAFHDWIPERVFVTACVTPRRKKLEFNSDQFGQFTFHSLATQKGRHLELVERIVISKQAMLVAKPIRALLDLVCIRKEPWQGLGWLTEGMRIDEDELQQVTTAELEILKKTYKHKRVLDFIDSLQQALQL